MIILPDFAMTVFIEYEFDLPFGLYFFNKSRVNACGDFFIHRES